MGRHRWRAHCSTTCSRRDRRHRHFGPLLRPQEESRRSAQDDKVLSSERRPGVDLLQTEPLLNHSQLTEPRLSSVPGPGKQSLHQLPATCTGVFRGNPSISRRSTSTATSDSCHPSPRLSLPVSRETSGSTSSPALSPRPLGTRETPGSLSSETSFSSDETSTAD